MRSSAVLTVPDRSRISVGVTYQSGAVRCYHVRVKIVGRRLRKARELRGVSQLQLANRLDNARHMISMVEHGRSGLSLASLSAAAQALGVSTDFLFGLTDDPTPAHDLARSLATSGGRVRDLEEQQARAGSADDSDHVDVCELAAAAGGGAVDDDERIVGHLKFPREWLDSHGLAARECRIIRVLGESMEPTLADGCSVLVDRASRRRRTGRIYVVRTDEGLVVKRAGRDGAGGWRLVSDHPDKQAWPTLPWPDDAPVIGEVRWVGRTFS